MIKKLALALALSSCSPAIAQEDLPPPRLVSSLGDYQVCDSIENYKKAILTELTKEGTPPDTCGTITFETVVVVLLIPEEWWQPDNHDTAYLLGTVILDDGTIYYSVLGNKKQGSVL